MNSEDTIAVVIPVYKSALYIRTALDSVLRQSIEPSEIIVIDDGSPDESGAIAASYGDRVRVIRQQNRGMASARNSGVHCARSAWVMFLDHDDVCEIDRLKKTRQAIRTHPFAKWVYSDYTQLNLTTQRRTHITTPDPSTIEKEVRYKCTLIPSISSIRRDALLAIEGFSERPDMVGVDDHDLLIRFMREFGAAAFVKVPESLCLYSLHESSYGQQVWDHFRGRIALLTTQLEDLSGTKKLVWKRILMARLHYDIAIMLREQKAPGYFGQSIHSLMQWPFTNRALSATRYKVILHMLFTRTKSFLQTFPPHS